MATWESSKENVQPLRHGRKSNCLTSLIKPSEQDIDRLLRERQKFEEEIVAESNKDDPIDAWDRYLNWALQNFVESSSNNFFQELLVKFVSKFSKLERYKSDLRLVNAWLLSCDRADDPLALFSYMHTNNIGAACASMYVAWADKYEMSGDMKRAEMIYKQAEKANAQPFQYLKQMQSQFEMRFARSIMQKNFANKSDDNIATNIFVDDDEVAQTRSAMTELRGFGQRKKVGTQRTGIATTNGLQVRGYDHQALHTVGNEKGPKFEIFNENDPSTGSVPGFKGKWNHLPNENVDNSENLQNATTWTAAEKIKQKYRSTSLSMKCPPVKEACFDVYMDEDDDENVQAYSRPVACNVEQILRTRDKSKPLSNDIMQIMNGPPRSEPGKVSMYDVDKVYNVMGEMEFQQIRAAYWRLKQKKNNTHLNSIINHVQQLHVADKTSPSCCIRDQEDNVESSHLQSQLQNELFNSATMNNKTATEDEVLSWLQGPLPATYDSSKSDLPFTIFDDNDAQGAEAALAAIKPDDYNQIYADNHGKCEEDHTNRKLSLDGALTFSIFQDQSPCKTRESSKKSKKHYREEVIDSRSAIKCENNITKKPDFFVDLLPPTKASQNLVCSEFEDIQDLLENKPKRTSKNDFMKFLG